MAHTHHAHRGAVSQVDDALLMEHEQRAFYILRHTAGIASRAVFPGYASLFKIFRVEVVEPNGGRNY